MYNWSTIDHTLNIHNETGQKIYVLKVYTSKQLILFYRKFFILY